MQPIRLERFCGQVVSKKQLIEIAEIIKTFPKLSRTELANTICEIFSWKRPTGKPKSVECRQHMEELDEKGVVKLPASRKQYALETLGRFSGPLLRRFNPLFSQSQGIVSYKAIQGRKPGTKGPLV